MGVFSSQGPERQRGTRRTIWSTFAAMVAVLGISDSSKAGLVAQLDKLGTNLLTVTPGQTFFGASAQLPEAADKAVLNLATVRNAAAVTAVTTASLRSSPYIEAAETSGITVEAADLGLLTTLSGAVALSEMRVLCASRPRTSSSSRRLR